MQPGTEAAFKRAWACDVLPALRLGRCRVKSLLPKKMMERRIVRSYRKTTGRGLDFRAPRSYSQKLCVAKLYCATPEKTRLTDKWQVREWVAEKIGAQYLVPLCAPPCNSFSELDFSALPQSFVLKCSHDSGSTTLVWDKEKLDMRRLKKQYDFYMRRNFAYVSFEMHYKDIPPRLLVEKNLSGDGQAVRDYKFICFHGKPYYCWVDIDRFGAHKRITYDMDWNVQPFVQHTYPPPAAGADAARFCRDEAHCFRPLPGV